MEYGFAPILMDRRICRDLERSGRLEWVNTNKTGAYAMGTVAELNTRRYHGLLVAALDPPFARYVVLNTLNEELDVNGQTYMLSTQQFKTNCVEPCGFENLNLFRLDPFPIWSYQLGDHSLTKHLFLIEGKQAVAIQYRASSDCTLRVRPYISYRDYHDMMHVNSLLNQQLDIAPGRVRMSPYPGLPQLTMQYGEDGSFDAEGCWRRDFEYVVERERGMDEHEDLYSPGVITLELNAKGLAWIVVSIKDENDTYSAQKLKTLTDQYRGKSVIANSPFEARLTSAADKFRAVREDNNRPVILAGFPWFAAWGRDAMISLPGVLITRGYFDEARGVIEGMLHHLNQGVIPNYYPDVGAPEYNTMDATLWMFQAVWSYIECGGPLSWVKDVFYPIAKTIMRWHESGTFYEIHVDSDGLLYGGEEGTMVTWMDAKVGDWVVTPRIGKPVEINALWYNALCMMAHWAAEFEEADYAQKMRGMADRAKESFEAKFWNEAAGCAFDVIDGPNGNEAKIRPNQIFTAALPFTLFDIEKRKAIMTVAKDRLLTPVGPRSLDPGDPDYHPHYEGDRHHRDAAYHNGTVWPWLTGPFVTAYLRTFGRSKENVAYCKEIVNSFETSLLGDSLGSINEIYDGDPPHTARGCIAQAWSVAEILRVLRSDLTTALE